MTALPLPALVGLDLARQALLLLAVEPGLRGAVFSAAVGTGKSSLARGIRALLGDDDTPFVEIPTSIDIENLVGGLDLEATLRTGQVAIQPGALARAHRGFAYVDGINLLTDGIANQILAALDNGEVRVEREGVSRVSPARFNLIGSYDPAEGPPRRHLLDRLGLIVPLSPATTPDQRETVIRRNLLTHADLWAEDLQFVRGLVLTAREHLPNVDISPAQIRQLSATALHYGVEGHRVDLFAVMAARAAAALELRDEVSDEDLLLAARLVIVPRATHIPASPPPEQPPPPPPPEPEQTAPDESDAEGEEPPPLPDTLLPPPEQILEALETALPDALEDLPFQTLQRGQAGSRGSTDGKRGRHVRSVPGNPSRQRIDVVATLRSAAPWQRVRANKAAAKKGNNTRRVRLEMDDIRVKQYRSKAGALFCFAVDASGSMALHRMRQAKGAVHALLQKAYVHRDRVALIAFRGEQAELLLPPSQSVELARRALDLLPTGGGTPLASALLLADDIAQQARQRGILQTVLVLLTDGRANVGLGADSNVRDELQRIGRYIAASPLRVIVVDTQRSYLSRGEARQLAEWLGGDYAYLPNASGGHIADLATSVAGG